MLKYALKTRPTAAVRSGGKYAFLPIYVQYVENAARGVYVYAGMYLYMHLSSGMQVAAIIMPACSQSSSRAENSGGDVSSCIDNQL